MPLLRIPNGYLTKEELEQFITFQNIVVFIRNKRVVRCVLVMDPCKRIKDLWHIYRMPLS